MLKLKLDDTWKYKLKGEFNKPYFEDLMTFVNNEYKSKECFPPINQIFAAFEYCKFEDVKVVIIGQDPYHGFGQANGLSFSVNDGIKFPPSLQNFFKEMTVDIGKEYPKSGNLEYLAKQGVLLLNATLTVRSNEAGSHQGRGWEVFTDAVISTISENKENVIFLLWGGFARKKTKLIDNKKHYVLECGHPSPLSANRGYWFGNKHFSKTNSLLEKDDSEPVIW